MDIYPPKPKGIDPLYAISLATILGVALFWAGYYMGKDMEHRDTDRMLKTMGITRGIIQIEQ
jgi:hypothetical protein